MLKTQNLRQLEKKDLFIKNIYNRYRVSKYVKGVKSESYIEFPLVDDEILVSGSDRIDEVKKMGLEGKTSYRKKVYIPEEGKYGFVKVVNDAEFFKNTSKVFDFVFVTEKPVEVEYYRYPKGNIKEETTEINVTGIGAGKVKSMIAGIVDEEPPIIDGKDKLGAPAKVPAYDYEDTFKDKLIGRFIKMKVSGNGIDTKYIFSEGKEFTIDTEETPIKDTKFEEIFDTPF